MILVTGAGGFIGGHLVARLLAEGNSVRAVDSKPAVDWHQFHEKAENFRADVGSEKQALEACHGVSQVFNLAADMGGMGFIENNKALCMLSVLPSTHMLVAAREQGVQRFFYSSSACVYPGYRQNTTTNVSLREADAYPAEAEDGYGWEKLFTERMCRHFYEDFGLETRVARYHNVYGPLGTWQGGREKAPAALCRKIAQAKISGDRDVEVWGHGRQTRSFMFVDDCVEGTMRIMAADCRQPLNLGSSELIAIDELAVLICKIAGLRRYRLNFNPDAPVGVQGRNSDNAMIREEIGWEPSITLQAGLEKTYKWIFDQVNGGFRGGK